MTNKDSQNLRQKAVALKHDIASETAPKVVAKGRGLTAQKIIDLAQKNNIPVHEDPDLVDILSAIELNEEIPPELYRVVAEVLAMIYRVNKGMKTN